MRAFRFVAALIGAGASCSLIDGPEDGTFRGIYVTAFEASAFRPCGTRESWWLTDASGTLHAQLPPVEPPDFARAAFLRVRGRRSESGQFGHLGSYERELVVREVLEVVADTSGTCP